jgi:outer membrane protein insertion porin family
MTRPPLLLLLAALLVAFLGAPAHAQDWGWAEGEWVQRVEFEGNQTIHDSELQGMVSTRPGQTFSADALAEDIARLYRSGRFGTGPGGEPPIAVEVSESDGAVVVVFRIHERRPVRLVVLEGPDGLDRDELGKLMTTRPGALYDDFAVERDVRELRKHFRAEGHLYADVDVRTESREGGVDVFFALRPGPSVHVDEIVFEGAEQLDPSILADAQGPDALETKEQEVFGLLEKGAYDPKAFERDMDRISRYYRSQGFLDVQVYKKAEQFDMEGQALTLVVQVEEGPRYRVRRVGIEGTRVLSEERLMREIGLRPGRPFLGEDLRDAMERIRHLYGQRAHIHAQVDVDVRYDRQRHLLDVTLRVSEGPKVRVEQIRIEGNDKTQEKVIRRELSIYPGEYFDSDEIQASLARLGRLRYFNDIRLDFEPGTEPGRENLVLRVQEARTGSFVLGGGISTSAGFFGNISLSQRNFDIFDLPTSWRDFIEGRALTGAGQSITLSLQPGKERSQFSIEFTEPYLFDYPVILGLEGFLRDRVREDWLESRRSARVTLGYRFTQDLLGRATYRIERVRVADIELDAVPDVIRDAGTNYLSGFRFSLNLDKNLIDRHFVAYGGWAASAYYEVVGGALGGSHTFHRAGGSANWQISLLDWPGDYKWVLGLKSEIGWQRPFGKDPIPIFERFFAGGPNSLRGFEFRTVTPQLRDKPLGGDFMLLGTAEFSFPIFRDIVRGVGFMDAGAVTATIDDYDEWDVVRVAAGFGFRIKIPVFPAPVALDFAWPLQKKKEDDPQVFSFSVGFGF